MRFQAKGHIQSRLSAWAIYIYCRSRLINLSVKDAIQYSVYDTLDTIKSALIFLSNSTHRIEILFDSQILTGSNKKGTDFYFDDADCCHLSNLTDHSVPKPSNTRWPYLFEIVRFACQHYSAIILAFTTISQSKGNGSSDGRRYVTDLLKSIFVFQIHLLRDVPRSAMKFLRQIEKRGLCLDGFPVIVNAAKGAISQTMNNFDFVSFRATLNNIKDYAPVTTLTLRSTRLQQQSTNTDIDEVELRKMGNDFVQHVLKSVDENFNAKAQELIQN